MPARRDIIERNRTIFDPALITRYKTAFAYVDVGLSGSLWIRQIYDQAVARGVPTDHPILSHWATQWENQKQRATAYQDLVLELKRLDAAKPMSREGRQNLSEQFGYAVEMLELWVDRMKIILADEELLEFVAEQGKEGKK